MSNSQPLSTRYSFRGTPRLSIGNSIPKCSSVRNSHSSSSSSRGLRLAGRLSTRFKIRRRSRLRGWRTRLKSNRNRRDSCRISTRCCLMSITPKVRRIGRRGRVRKRPCAKRSLGNTLRLLRGKLLKRKSHLKSKLIIRNSKMDNISSSINITSRN